MRRLRCRLGLHAWRITNYPEWQYYGVSSFAGTLHCRYCKVFRWMTPEEEARYL